MKISTIENDSTLILSVRNGDDRAFSKLVKRWYQRIYNYAMKYHNNRVTSQEVVQQTFIQVHKNIHQLQDVNSFKYWIYRIANNQCITEGRKLSSKTRKLVSGGEIPTEVVGERPYETMEKQERAEIVRSAIQKLKPEQKEVIIMKEYEGMKFREIAAVLQLTESTVKSRLYSGLVSLKELLEKESILAI